MATGNTFNNILKGGVKLDITNKAPGALVTSGDATGTLSYLPLGAANTFLGNVGGVLGYYDLGEQTQDIVGSLITASARVIPTYNDAANTLSLDIIPNSIDGSFLAQIAPLTIKGNPTNALANQSDISFGTTGSVLMRNGNTLVTGLISASNISNSAITYAKIQNVSAGSILGNLSGNPSVISEISIFALKNALQVSPVIVTTTAQSIAVGNTYIANNLAEITFTLPAVAGIGDTFKIIGKKGSGGWRVNQLANQFQIVGILETTPGVTAGNTGTIRSGAGEVTACAEWICTGTGAVTEWMCLPHIGNVRVDE